MPMLTGKKALRGGAALWRDIPGGRARTRRTLTAETCDVAIVGGGVSGALIALMLTKANFDVVVIDRRAPGSGSTAASTAMIQFELDTPLRELMDKIGSQRAIRAYRRSLKAVEDLALLIEESRIRCDWRVRDAVYLSGNQLGWRGLKSEAAARRKCGLPSQYVDSRSLHSTYGIDRTGAIVSQGAGELNPARLTAGALSVAAKRGCRVYAQQEAVEAEIHSGGVRLVTRSGGIIDCRKAVFATGYETVDGLPKGKFDITSSWAIATKPVGAKKLWPTRCLLWEASDPYLYVRTTLDNRVVAGGEDSALTDPARRDAAISNKAQKLLASLNDLLPGRDFELDYAWAGAFAVSPTGLPIFTTLPGSPNCMAVLGCGGNGITFSVIAAQVVTAWVGDRRDPDAALFETAGY